MTPDIKGLVGSERYNRYKAIGRAGPWPMKRMPTDLEYIENADGILRISRKGIVFLNGYIIAKIAVCDVDDTRNYLEVVSGGE